VANALGSTGHDLFGGVTPALVGNAHQLDDAHHGRALGVLRIGLHGSSLLLLLAIPIDSDRYIGTCG
jgi:hypothetical protein